VATFCQEIVKLLPDSISDYADLISDVEKLPADKKSARLRKWCQTDLYFLIRYALKRFDIEHPWLLERCREVQAHPDGMLDLWAREHYKSTIITFGLTIQDILNDPEITVGIFSHTRPIAKGFLRQIKGEFEVNRLLSRLFPDILYSDPKKEAKKWSEDDGIVVQRKSNPKEATIEAWGLVDGMPTSKHYKLIVYDDVVTKESVSTPEMILKVTDAWALSRNLAAQGGRERYIGTRYHAADTYDEIMKRGSAIPRIHTARKQDGIPVFMSEELLIKKRRDMGPYVYSCQMDQAPSADQVQGLKSEWLNHYKNVNHEGLSRYILVDPANEKRKTNDYSSFWVIGLGSDRNYYALDIIRDRLNLAERTRTLFELHRKWIPLGVAYEQYGMQADIQHIIETMERESYRFTITQVGGSMPKLDRIRRLIPLFEQGRIWLPQTCYKTNYEKRTEDLVSVFTEEEYKPFPVMRHDDMLDNLARLEDEEFKPILKWPMLKKPSAPKSVSHGLAM
jgi:predicted phage terminase large subunit-like protein